jgi:hypothetical protein
MMDSGSRNGLAVFANCAILIVAPASESLLRLAFVPPFGGIRLRERQDWKFVIG